MTDREKYKSAVDAVASSQMRKLEASDIMAHNHQKNYRFKGLVIAAAAVLLLVGVCGGAYAADVGGIQSKVQVWFRGELTDVTLDISTNGNSSEYTVTFTDAEGNPREIHGGGVAMGWFGKERPLTEEEILENLNSPEVVYEDDGTVWVYSGSEKVEITDMFNEDGYCFVKLTGGKKPLYMTIKYQEGYSTSNNKYVEPEEYEGTVR